MVQRDGYGRNGGDEIAIIGWAVSAMVRNTDKTEVQMLLEVITDAVSDAGITRKEVDFTCAGSCDYVAGQAFSFVQNIDAIGAWPPKRDSHVEMDGAWALYEAWIRLLIGDIDVALAMGSGRSSTADPALIYPMEMDPFYLAPLGADATSLAALQARALLDSAKVSERQMAEIAARCRRDAKVNPHAQVAGDFDPDDLLAGDYVRAPLRRHDLPPITDGACAVVIARADKARELCERPVWITGFAHYSELHNPGMRDLTTSRSTTLAAKAAGVDAPGADAARLAPRPVEVAEIQAAYTHEEPLLVEALGVADAVVNPSGGPLAANPIMATGLVRVAEAARQIRDQGRHRTLAHATSGPCLQQNLVCVLEESERN
jgi:acetyl-CoA acetyltransferase